VEDEGRRIAGERSQPVSERELSYWMRYLRVAEGEKPAEKRARFLAFMRARWGVEPEHLGFVDGYFDRPGDVALTQVATALYRTYGSASSPYLD
jgi:hypothetical protein